MKISPIYNYVAIKPDLESAVTPGGIILPDGARRIMAQGVVHAVGPKHVLDKTGIEVPTTLKPGMRVIYGRWAGAHQSKIDGETYVFITEGEVFAVLESDDESTDTQEARERARREAEDCARLVLSSAPWQATTSVHADAARKLADLVLHNWF